MGSKAATMLREGDIAIRAGELPALRGAIRASVSFCPSMNLREPKLVVEVTPCAANTRKGMPLGGLVVFDPPQEGNIKLAHKPTTIARIRFFKRQAPKDMKKGYLGAKWWII